MSTYSYKDIDKLHQKLENRLKLRPKDLKDWWQDENSFVEFLKPGNVELAQALEKAYWTDRKNGVMVPAEEYFYEDIIVALGHCPNFVPVLEDFLKKRPHPSMNLEEAMTDAFNHECKDIFVWCFERHINQGPKKRKRPMDESLARAYQEYVFPFGSTLKVSEVSLAMEALETTINRARDSDENICHLLDTWSQDVPFLRDSMLVLINSDIELVEDFVMSDFPFLVSYGQKRILGQVVSGSTLQDNPAVPFGDVVPSLHRLASAKKM